MLKQPKFLLFLTILSPLLFLVDLYLIFYYAPLEAIMNYVQKIFYIHLACAWVGMVGFLVAAFSGFQYLRTKELAWDIVEAAAVEISLVFFFIAIVSGSIWARPTWGTWWTWDARLTTAAILEMIYVAYLMLREGIDDPERRARFGAIYTLVGGLSVPLTFFSIRLWQTIHPVLLGTQSSSGQAEMNLPAPMLATMLFGLFTFTILFITLLWHRIRLGKLVITIESLKN
jgi:heme exporter protein C